jgi:hypothetical protein
MKMFDTTRRQFLKGSVGFLAAASFNPQLVVNEELNFSREEAPDPNKIGILQGVTNRDQTVLSVVAHKKFGVRFSCVGPNNPHVEVSPFIKSGSEFILYNLIISNLAPDQDYELIVLNRLGHEMARRNFQSLDLRREDLRMAIVSCSDQRRNPVPLKINENFNIVRPDIVLGLGDMVYADSNFSFNRPARPLEAYQRYVKSLQRCPFSTESRLVPVYSLWDDHDTGLNNAGADHPFLSEMSQIFRKFYPRISNEEMQSGPGMSFALKVAGLEVLTLDARSFAGTDHLIGAKQLQWAKQIISGSEGPLLMACGILFRQYHFWGESFHTRGPEEYQSIMKTIKDSGRPAIFASGDIHYSQVQEIGEQLLGYKSFELTSSAYYSSSAGEMGRRNPSSGQLCYYGGPNFLLLENIKTSQTQLSAQVNCVSENSLKEFARDIDVKSFPRH